MILPQLPIRSKYYLTMTSKSVCFFQGSWDQPAQQAIHVPLVVRQPQPSPSPSSGATKSDETTSDVQTIERPFNPAEDVLYVRAEDFRHFTNLGLQTAPWAPELTHLAIPLRHFDSGAWLPYAFIHMPKLKTLSFVFPSSTGTTDIYAPVILSDAQEAHPLLRKLTPEEGDQLKIDANYSRENPFGTDFLRVQYTVTAREHAESSFEHMEMLMWGGMSQEHMPPYCSKLSKKLDLEWEVACFVGS
jgi:hypothetical protein